VRSSTTNSRLRLIALAQAPPTKPPLPRVLVLPGISVHILYPSNDVIMFSPRDIPLPMSPLSPGPGRPGLGNRDRSSSSTSVASSNFQPLPPPELSPRSLFRPKLDRSGTSITLRAESGRDVSPPDPFKEGATISVNQPVGSLSISPSSRDVCLASRKGLYILDLANLNNAPRFVPQGGTWQIAE
jgi:hypothetical protein